MRNMSLFLKMRNVNKKIRSSASKETQCVLENQPSLELQFNNLRGVILWHGLELTGLCACICEKPSFKDLQFY